MAVATAVAVAARAVVFAVATAVVTVPPAASRVSSDLPRLDIQGIQALEVQFQRFKM